MDRRSVQLEQDPKEAADGEGGDDRGRGSDEADRGAS